MSEIKIRDLPQVSSLQMVYTVAEDAVGLLRAHGEALRLEIKNNITKALQPGETGYYAGSIWRIAKDGTPVEMVDSGEMTVISMSAHSSLVQLEGTECVSGIRKSEESEREILVTKTPDPKIARAWIPVDPKQTMDLVGILLEARGFADQTTVDEAAFGLKEKALVLEVNESGKVINLYGGLMVEHLQRDQEL